MSPRPKKVSDEEVFMAAQRAMSRRGPMELTLADIAAEAGVTPGRLVQRFGGKRGLLLAISARFGDSGSEVFAGLRRAHRSPLATLRAYVSCMADLAATPEALARNLAYLQIDLTDPDFRVHLVRHPRATRREIEVLLREALEAGAESGHQSATSGAERGNGDQRIVDDLGVLPGRICRAMDAP